MKKAALDVIKKVGKEILITLSSIIFLTLYLSSSTTAIDETIKLATTTSTDNSGLLDVLIPPFTEKYGIKVHVIAVGTGTAIQHGENGDVDVILVHAPSVEKKFVADGHGVNRRSIMHNDFVIVGPASDPAGLQGMRNALTALEKISRSKSLFVSRGDDSGTHKKEKELWEETGIIPKGDWYMSVGQGMGATLIIAQEKNAYTLSDRGTYFAYKDKIDLKMVVEGGSRLFNPYGVIAVNPARHKHVKYMEAMMFIAWLTSIEGQTIIANFKIGGEQLFIPDATK